MVVSAVVFCAFTDDSSSDHDNDLAVNLESCSEAKSPEKSTSNKKKSTTKTTKAKLTDSKLSNTVTKDKKKKRKLTILSDTSIDDDEASLIEVFDVGHKLLLFFDTEKII